MGQPFWASSGESNGGRDQAGETDRIAVETQGGVYDTREGYVETKELK